MRGAFRLALGLVLLLGCRSEVSEPELRRPLETMPEGACMLLLASDLANTWERAEAHDALGVLQRSLPADVVTPPALMELRARLAEFERESGLDARQDLVLNMLGRRVAMGVYPEGAGDEPGLLFVAELEDATRFRKSLDAFLQSSEPAWEVEKLDVDGRPALHIRDGTRLDLLLVQDGELLVVSSREALVRGALAIQHGSAHDSALHDSLCIQALEELGPHSMTVVELQRNGLVPWGAQGVTWDREGVHFKRVIPGDAEPPDQGDSTWRRDEILGSIPSGMTMAYYARPAEAGRLRELFRRGSCLTLQSSSAPASSSPWSASRRGASSSLTLASIRGGGTRLAVDAPLGLERLPLELLKEITRWAGDEMAVVVEELRPTALAPMPSAALILEANAPELAAQSLHALELGLPVLPIMNSRGFIDVSYGGKTFRSLAQPIMEVLAPSYLVDDDMVILTSTRELMQRIIDTRRVGKRSFTRQSSLRPFAAFVPDDASAVVYTDQTKLHHLLLQLADLPRLWGEDVARSVETLEGLTVLFEHFPASAVYVEQTPRTLVLNGWMREQE